MWRLGVQRFSVTQTSAHELRPVRDSDVRCDPLREQSPQLRVMPAKFLLRTVPMRADSSPQPFHFIDEFLRGETLEIFVHRSHCPNRPLAHARKRFEGGGRESRLRTRWRRWGPMVSLCTARVKFYGGALRFALTKTHRSAPTGVRSPESDHSFGGGSFNRMEPSLAAGPPTRRIRKPTCGLPGKVITRPSASTKV